MFWRHNKLVICTKVNLIDYATKHTHSNKKTNFSYYTTINRTIVLFNGLFDDLDYFQNKNQNDKILVEACEMYKNKLSKYYSRTDLTSVFSCSTFVNPCL